jgi:hypothetical protein
MAPTLSATARPEAVLSHSASRVVTVEELAAMPTGPSLGPQHRPVPHVQLVSAVKQAFEQRGYAVERELFTVSHDTARLFGTLDLIPTTGAPVVDGFDSGMAVGLRHANDKAFALGVIAGMRVFVCDNLAFSGGDRLLRRKHTTGLDLVAEINRGMDRTFASYAHMARLVDRMRDTQLSDREAKLLMYDLALEGHVVSPSQLGKVHGWYFTPELVAGDSDRERGFADVQPRSAWGVMNAVTRVARDYPQARQQQCGVALSRYLGQRFRVHAAEVPAPN